MPNRISTSSSSSRSKRNDKDSPMALNRILVPHQNSSHPRKHREHRSSSDVNSRSSSSTPPPHHNDSETMSVSNTRRDFVIAITRPSDTRGHLVCRLCNEEVWGPNGRYHIDKCAVLIEARERARRYNTNLTCVAGIPVHPDVFKSPKRPEPKPAKIPGFVMSHSVSVADPSQALTESEIQSGMQRGRKGYVRCIKCNHEVFAPNARTHLVSCQKR